MNQYFFIDLFDSYCVQLQLQFVNVYSTTTGPVAGERGLRIDAKKKTKKKKKKESKQFRTSANNRVAAAVAATAVRVAREKDGQSGVDWFAIPFHFHYQPQSCIPIEEEEEENNNHSTWYSALTCATLQ